ERGDAEGADGPPGAGEASRRGRGGPRREGETPAATRSRTDTTGVGTEAARLGGASGVEGAPRTGAGTRPRREGGGGQSEGRGRESPRGPAGTQGTRGRLGQATRRRRGSREGAQGADAGPPSRPERAGQGPRRTRTAGGASSR